MWNFVSLMDFFISGIRIVVRSFNTRPEHCVPVTSIPFLRGVETEWELATSGKPKGLFLRAGPRCPSAVDVLVVEVSEKGMDVAGTRRRDAEPCRRFRPRPRISGAPPRNVFRGTYSGIYTYVYRASGNKVFSIIKLF